MNLYQGYIQGNTAQFKAHGLLELCGVALSCALILACALAGCGGSKTYKDGTYTGKSAVFSGDVEGNFKTYEENGTLKDENYGMADGEIKNQDYYNKAQKAIKGSEAYAKEIIGKINPDEVDSISGATYSHNQFTDAVYDALDKAAEKH